MPSTHQYSVDTGGWALATSANPLNQRRGLLGDPQHTLRTIPSPHSLRGWGGTEAHEGPGAGSGSTEEAVLGFPCRVRKGVLREVTSKQGFKG